MFAVVKKSDLPEGMEASQQGRNAKYPFADLEVGDAFAVPVVDDVTANAAQVKMSAPCAYHSKNGKKFGTRLDRESGCIWVIRKA